MADELITSNELAWLVSDATELFSPELINIASAASSKLDALIAMLDTLSEKIQGAHINMSSNYSARKDGDTSAKFHALLNENVNSLYVELTKIYYLVRTYLTGETISFLENIEGTLKVIDQDDWLKLLTNKSATEWGVSTSKIFLLETDLMNVGTSIDNSNQMAKIQNYNEIINTFIHYGEFEWETEHPIVGYYKTKYKLYQKQKKDTLVYAYYNGGKKHNLQLLYNLKIHYNLGQLQETIIDQLEQLYTMYPTVIDKIIASWQDQEHPIGIFLGGWKRNSVPGLVEGDLRSATQQWIQSKRHNEKVISTLQIHKATIKLRNNLTLLQDSLKTGNIDEVIDQLANNFYNMFSSEKQNINDKLRDKIRRQLPTLLNQQVI